MLAAVIFPPADPEGPAFDLTVQMLAGIRRGMKLYYNGRQFALFTRRPKTGFWALVTQREDTPPCAA